MAASFEPVQDFARALLLLLVEGDSERWHLDDANLQLIADAMDETADPAAFVRAADDLLRTAYVLKFEEECPLLADRIVDLVQRRTRRLAIKEGLAGSLAAPAQEQGEAYEAFIGKEAPRIAPRFDDRSGTSSGGLTLSDLIPISRRRL